MQHLAWQIRPTITVTKLREIEDDRICRLRRNPGCQVLQRPAGEEFHLYSPRHGRHYLPCPPLQFQVQGRHSADDKDTVSVGLQASCNVDGAAKIIAVYETSGSGRKHYEVTVRIWKAMEHQPRSRPQFLSVSLEEVERRLRNRHDHVNVQNCH